MGVLRGTCGGLVGMSGDVDNECRRGDFLGDLSNRKELSSWELFLHDAPHYPYSHCHIFVFLAGFFVS